MSLYLSLQHASLKFANREILRDANWQIHQGQRFALIGRNGVGKSSLLQVIQAQIHLDAGVLQLRKGLRIAALPQDLNHSYGETVFADILYRTQAQGGSTQGLSLDDFSFDAQGRVMLHTQHHDEPLFLEFVAQCNQLCQVMQVNAQLGWQQLSGGMKRRVALIAALLVNPDILLLDEPTNHLDLTMILWLEQFLVSFKGAVVFVTHDRYFLKAVANQVLALEQGQLRHYPQGYEAYLNQRAAELATEQHERDRLRHRLEAEEHWLQRGVTARRARNQGRLKALHQLRQTVAQRQQTLGMPGQWNPQILKSGRVLLTAEHLNFEYAQQVIVKDFSCMLMRGDKLGIVGPNGCGKTTLARLLLGDLLPSSGILKSSLHLTSLYFDQLQAQLDINATLFYNIADGHEYIELPQGKVHVATYLKDFLFYPDQFQRPVYTLSGGERQRLMLAKCLAQPANLLVFDEPSNDLDLESLEQLSAMMVGFQGSFILISHDRALIEDVVTRLLVWESPGVFREILPERWQPNVELVSEQKNLVTDRSIELDTKKGLSYLEQKELLKIPDELAKVEDKILNLHQCIAQEGFYSQSEAEIKKVLQHVQVLEEQQKQLFQRWEILEQLKGS